MGGIRPRKLRRSKHRRVVAAKLFRRDAKIRGGRWGSLTSPFENGNVRWIKCYYCGEYIKVAKATIAHIAPRCRGESDNFDNLALACSPCNQEDSKKYNKPYVSDLGQVVLGNFANEQ